VSGNIPGGECQQHLCEEEVPNGLEHCVVITGEIVENWGGKHGLIQDEDEYN